MSMKSRNLSILIVEDSRTQAERLRFTLESNDYEVQLAQNGKEGLAMLAERKPDLVISDINMPEMDGYELCRHIKSDSKLAEVPVILLTALAETRDLMRGLECGADSYLTKPYDTDDLIKSIGEALEDEKSWLEKNTLIAPFHGETFRIDNNAPRLLKFLMTTYNLAVKKNDSLANANALLHDEIAERKSAQERLRRSNESLSTLYKVSTVVSQTLQLDDLIEYIIKAVTTIGVLQCEPRGLICLAEEEGLRIAYELGLSAECKKNHSPIPYGTCLCGLAAKTGEVIVSMNSDTDIRHTIHPPGMSVHGHIVIPLKAKERLVGVLCLYLEPDIPVERSNDMSELFVALGQQIGMALDNARLYAEVEKSSLHDPLTGLANRRRMDIDLKKHFSATQRRDGPLSLIMFDIDHFKRFNDTMGHAEGDKTLAAVAHIASDARREMDTVFRYGGEEFLVLLPDTPLSGALVVAEAIRSAIEEQAPVTVSLGVASYADGMKDVGALIVEADAALYRAKKNGRNRVES